MSFSSDGAHTSSTLSHIPCRNSLKLQLVPPNLMIISKLILVCSSRERLWAFSHYSNFIVAVGVVVVVAHSALQGIIRCVSISKSNGERSQVFFARVAFWRIAQVKFNESSSFRKLVLVLTSSASSKRVRERRRETERERVYVHFAVIPCEGGVRRVGEWGEF